MNKLPKKTKPQPNIDARDICPECGQVVRIGDFPFCPHEKTWNYTFRMKIYGHDRI